MTNIIFGLTILAALGSGLIAGVFFAFSTSVMKALGRIPPAEGMAAMQSINIVIINPVFLGAFLGTGIVSIVLAIVSLIRWQSPESAYLLAAALLYLIGSLLVTMVINVPMNDALAAATPADGLDIWTNYLSNWTFWNHIRTLASLTSMAAFIMALAYSTAK